MSNIHDLDDDDEAMKILEKISFEKLKKLRKFCENFEKVLMRE
jgi:hypothetical protein